MSAGHPADDQERASTARWTAFLGWGEHGRPDLDDPAEAYHEASKNLPSVMPVASAAAAVLDTDPQAQATIIRPVPRHLARPTVALPEPRYPRADLGHLLGQRRSRRHFGSAPLTMPELSTLLHAAYGVTEELETAHGTHHLRSVPSGGALYPLAIYPVVRNVDGVASGLYHFDPTRQLLETVREEDTAAHLGDLIIPLPGVPDLAATCGVVVFVAGVFWRTRFKYGLRGYRWVLIEAGHVGQNVLLTAEALGVHAVPYGGIWDRRVDDYLGLDGVNESVVYALAVGSAGAGSDGSDGADGDSTFS
ncbi:MAG: SagB family peptide dehydrogenase [Acidimicrobiales bacterium]